MNWKSMRKNIGIWCYDMSGELALTVIVGIGILLLIVLFLVWVVATYIATALGLTGLTWWAVSIILFLVINSIIGGIGANSR